MAAHQWHDMISILDRILDLDPEVRVSYIHEISKDDPSLKEELLKYLAAADASEGLWEDLIESSHVLVNEITSTDAVINLDEVFPPLKQAGPYRVIKLIARGGMGNVYLAERSDGQFERTVAVKILRNELSSKIHIKRFTSERNILSGLEHPNIARLYDGGLTTDKRPYLVMEFVDGVPITTYCKENKCTLKEILELFKQVCNAVEYAHRNLIVHRDLKPDNILVKDDGTVKVLDFGIAKIIDEELTPDRLVQTGGNLHMLSIQYAAPEQVTLEKITTGTDVYTLGLLLYEMIAGRTPFELKGKKLKEIEQVIRFDTPEKPSSKISDPGRFRKVKGDLDAIILKALQKEPENRYNTVDQLIDDIQRFINGHPITAQRETLFYRTKKFILRQPAVVVAILTGMLAIWFYVFTLQMHADELEAERDKVESEVIRAGQISEFLVDLFESADPIRSFGEELTVRKLLEQGLERIDRLTEQPVIQTELSLTMARTYHALGDYEKALVLVNQVLVNLQDSYTNEQLLAHALTEKGIILRQLSRYNEAEISFVEALETQKLIFGKKHPDTAETLHNLAYLLQLKGELDEAEILYREVLEVRIEIFGDTHTDVATTMNNLGGLLRIKGEYDEAEILYRKAIEIEQMVFGPKHPAVAVTKNSLGLLLRRKGDYDQAELLYREALEIYRQTFIDNHPRIATILNNLGVLFLEKGEYNEAEILYREALEIRKQIFGVNHPTVAQSLTNLGALLSYKGAYDEAELMYREALEIRKQIFGVNHLDVTNTMNNLGILLQRKGAYGEAELIYREALEIRKQILGDNHHDVATIMNSLGLVFRKKGAYDEAELMYREALKIRKQNLGEYHPNVATTMNNLGNLLRIKGNYKEAEELIRNSLEMRRELLGNNHPRIAISLGSLGLLFQDLGNYDKAEPYFREALTLRIQILGEDHKDVAELMNYLGALLRKKGAYDEAESLIRKSLEMRRKLLGNNHPDIAQSKKNMGDLYLNMGSYEEAERLYHDALEMNRKLLGSDHPHVAMTYFSLGVLYFDRGDYNMAMSHLQKAYDIQEKIYSTDHLNLMQTMEKLDELHHLIAQSD